jgi:hypothetical protein
MKKRWLFLLILSVFFAGFASAEIKDGLHNAMMNSHINDLEKRASRCSETGET